MLDFLNGQGRAVHRSRMRPDTAAEHLQVGSLGHPVRLP